MKPSKLFDSVERSLLVKQSLLFTTTSFIFRSSILHQSNHQAKPLHVTRNTDFCRCSLRWVSTMMVSVCSQNVYLFIVNNSPQGNLTRYEMDYEA